MTLNQSEIRRRVVEQGCSDKAENERIYRKFFATVPRAFLDIVDRYHLGQKAVADIGCGYGHYLIHFGSGSVGLDANETSRRFAQSIGLRVLDCNVEEALPLEEGRYQAVWCANLIEHLVAPHLLLSRLHHALSPDGLLVAKVPVIPPLPVRAGVRLIGKPLGYEASEHINAFTPDTFRFTLERAGFQVVESISLHLGHPVVQAVTAPITRRLGASITAVARKDPHYSYGEKRIEAFDPDWMEKSYR